MREAQVRSKAMVEGRPQTIAPDHWREFIEGSGITPKIAELNFKSVEDPAEVDRLLNRNNDRRWKHWQHGPGWAVSGVDPETGEPSWLGAQFKPDEPVQRYENGQPKFKADGSPDLQKYFSASDYASEPLFLDTGDRNYWPSVLADVSRAVVVTEGSKKAGAGLSIGFSTISVPGVSCGQKLGELKPRLAQFCKVGRTVILAFDSDQMSKPQVRRELDRLGRLIAAEGAVVKVAMLPEDIKGLDDYLVKHGQDKTCELLQAAISLEQWRKEYLKGSESSKKPGRRNSPPPASTIARELAEKYRQHLAWNDEAESWYRYEAEFSGVWSAESDRAVGAVIAAELDRAVPDGYSLGYLRSVAGLLQHFLLARRWNQQPGLLPLENGVLDLATNKLLEHSPGYRLTWQLPYAYNPLATCEPIQRWMLEAMGRDAQLVELLRAYLKAIVTSRVDLQRFAECLGPAGTGKSTYVRLAIALVGLQNTHITTLQQLEHNRFEGAAARDKRLIVVSDSERYGGSVSNLKAITGQDPIRCEEKFKQAQSGTVISAMVLLSANEAIASTDYTSGLERRRLTVPFLNPVPAKERRDLLTITSLGVSGEFVPHLPGLLNWVLTMPEEDVTRLIRDTQTQVPSLSRWKAESLIESNPIAEWLDNRIVYDPAAKTYVGVAQKDKTSDSPYQFQDVNRWLYASYCEYSASVGNRAVSGRRFSGLLEDLCRNQLHLGVRKGRDRGGAFFEGLAIRNGSNDYLLRPITGELEAPPASSPPPDTGVTDEVTDCDGYVTGQTLASVECDGCDGLSENFTDKVKAQQKAGTKAELNESDQLVVMRSKKDFENNPSHPSQSVTINGSSHHATRHEQPVNPSPVPVIVEVIQELSKPRYNPATRRLEPQWEVKRSDGSTSKVFESELPNGGKEMEP